MSNKHITKINRWTNNSRNNKTKPTKRKIATLVKWYEKRTPKEKREKSLSLIRYTTYQAENRDANASRERARQKKHLPTNEEKKEESIAFHIQLCRFYVGIRLISSILCVFLHRSVFFSSHSLCECSIGGVWTVECCHMSLFRLWFSIYIHIKA